MRNRWLEVRVAPWIWVLCTSLACSGPHNGDSGDSGVGRDTGGSVDERTLRVGTGFDAYEPLTEGELVELVVGPQGGGRFSGFHIWSGFRVENYNPTDVRATYRIMTLENDVLALQERVYAGLEPNGDGFVSYGAAPRLDDCCLAETSTIVLRVDIVDGDGMNASASVEVRTGICEDSERPGFSLCP